MSPTSRAAVASLLTAGIIGGAGAQATQATYPGANGMLLVRGTIRSGCARPTFTRPTVAACHAGQGRGIAQESLFLADPRTRRVRLLAAGVVDATALDPSGRFSPNGRLIAVGNDVAADRSLRGLTIYALKRGVAPRPLEVHGLNPAWSPDGRRLAFWDPQRAADGQTLAENLFELSLTDAVPTLIRAGSFPTWSSRNRIAFFDAVADSVCTQRNYLLCVMRGGGGGVQLPGIDGVQADWSPEGLRLAVVQDDGYTGSLRIATGCTTGRGYHAITKAIQPTSAARELAYPTWSPDGRSMAFNYGGNIFTMPARPARPQGRSDWHRLLWNATLSDWQPIPQGRRPKRAGLCVGPKAPPPTG